MALLGLAIACPPAPCRHPSSRLLDAALLIALAGCALQVVPMPRGVVALVSPAAPAIENAFALVTPAGPRTLSIRPPHTLWAAALLAGLLLLFLTARRVFEAGGVRVVCRTAAFTGLILAGVAIAQDASAKGLMYWRFAPPREGPAPFGPFTNRNHFATWAMMGVPLCLGYLATHAAAQPGTARGWRRRVVASLDARAWMLGTAAMLLMVATAISLSRSGLAGLAVALAASAVLMRPSGPDRIKSSRGLVYGGAVTLAGTLGILTAVGPQAIGSRFGASGTAVVDRLAIWRDTVPVLRDFWLAGTGAGTFQTAMAVYQRSRPETIFNQAHNHYLQVAAEGGLLLGLPAAVALAALWRAGRRSLAADGSPIYFLRAGAAAGLLAVAVQSFWETGLTLPVNAALAAVLAAILVHTPLRSAGSR